MSWGVADDWWEPYVHVVIYDLMKEMYVMCSPSQMQGRPFQDVFYISVDAVGWAIIVVSENESCRSTLYFFDFLYVVCRMG